ncbi:adenylosuccinate synthase [bacterium]|nr:adenylosuccinate synthase [bacterium]
MSNMVLVGTQWGDEGKGKIIDILSEQADYIVRYQGGNNAGHTIVFDGRQFVLHLIPSGIFHNGKLCFIGNGLVVDPECLLTEIKELKYARIDIKGRFFISEDCHIIMPYHKLLDKIKESQKGKKKIGTTGRGIGPCYGDKYARTGIKFRDILDKEDFKEKLTDILAEKNELFEKIYKIKPLKFDEIYNDYLVYGEKLKQYRADVSLMINEAMDKNKNVLFEGAQGTLLDVDHGTYPYVTSSSPTAGGACTGVGVGPTKIDKVLGVLKAYTTRVGEGPFPTELPEKMNEFLRTQGKEFGATTGRARRCGWFDAVIGRYSVRINGLTSIALTKLDVLDELDEIYVCEAYKYKGKILTEFPTCGKILKKAAPVYKKYKGWKQNTSKIKKYEDLPKNAKIYIDAIKDMLGVDIEIISVGSDRNETIFKNKKKKIMR